MRAIDADALKKELSKRLWFVSSPEHDAQEIMDIIGNAPTIELKDIYQEGHYDGHLEGYTKAINEERPRGEWNYIQSDMCICPFCGAMPHKLYKNYCAKCGADMRKEEK